MKKLILLISFIVLGLTTQATVHVVDSLNDSGTGSLRSKVALAANGDTIRFNPSLIANGSDSIVLSSVISFSKNLTLVGLYTPTDTLFISGGQNNKILFADSTQFICLDSMVLINADTVAMSTHSVDSIVMKHSFFKENQGTGVNLLFCVQLSVHDCEFNQNAGSGLGVYFRPSVQATSTSPQIGNFTSSKFNSNSYIGLRVDDDNDSLFLFIEDCTFNYNTSTYKGGGLSLNSGRLTALIKDSEISNNTAHWGAGLYVETFHYTPQTPTCQLVDIENTIFSNNVASFQGGGIYTKFHSNFAEITRRLHIEHSTLSNNSVTDSVGLGGAIYSNFYGGFYPMTSTVQNNSINIEYSTVTGNTSVYQGGAIYSTTEVPTSSTPGNLNKLNIKNATIADNNSGSGGGLFLTTSNTQTHQDLHIVSSIVALNGDSNIIHKLNHPIISGGYNIFSDSLLSGSVATDQLNIDSTALNLGTLAFNGGFGATMKPITPSVAIDMGNPLDSSGAQNVHIFGIRDVGAAEANFATYATDTIVACSSYTWIDGVTYTANNNMARHILVGASVTGYDSVIILNLTLNANESNDLITACDSLTWVDGLTYYSSTNTPTQVYTNAAGCDSTVTLNLTILNSHASSEVVAACSSYTWNGITYTTSNNTATDTLVNALGCDSIVTLDLTILAPTTAIDLISSCDPITWLDGNTYSASNHTAVYTMQNTAGCDSVIILDFTLLQPTAGTDVISSCTEIIWIDGNVYSATTSGQTFTIPNTAGCDSVVTLDFTLLEVDTAVVRNYLTLTAQATNATYQWIDCDNGIMTNETSADFTATQNGDYQVEVTQNGCADTSACFSITNVGIQQAQLLGVNVYPNPTSDVLHIDKGSNVSLEITVTNSAGSIVYNSSTKDQITTINLAKMASGVYMVTLRNELGVSVERIVKR